MQPPSAFREKPCWDPKAQRLNGAHENTVCQAVIAF